MTQNQTPNAPDNEANLPEGIEPSSGHVSRIVKYPTSLFQDYYKICQKTGVAMMKMTVALVREFVNKNKHII